MKKKKGKFVREKPIVEFEIADGKEKIVHFFESTRQAYEFYLDADPPLQIWQSLISDCLRGRVKWAKKHRFRYATEKEIRIYQNSLEAIEKRLQKEVEEKITPNYDDWLEPTMNSQPADIIAANPNKPVTEEELSPFERMLKEKRGE